MSETREAALEWWKENRPISHVGLNATDGFRAGYDAAKSEPVTIERVAKALMLKLGCELWVETRMHPLEDICQEHDAAEWDESLGACGFAAELARAALAAQPVTDDDGPLDGCAGTPSCTAPAHQHGCFADLLGHCNEPEAHAAQPVTGTGTVEWGLLSKGRHSPPVTEAQVRKIAEFTGMDVVKSVGNGPWVEVPQ